MSLSLAIRRGRCALLLLLLLLLLLQRRHPLERDKYGHLHEVQNSPGHNGLFDGGHWAVEVIETIMCDGGGGGEVVKVWGCCCSIDGGHAKERPANMWPQFHRAVQFSYWELQPMKRFVISP